MLVEQNLLEQQQQQQQIAEAPPPPPNIEQPDTAKAVPALNGKLQDEKCDLETSQAASEAAIALSYREIDSLKQELALSMSQAASEATTAVSYKTAKVELETKVEELQEENEDLQMRVLTQVRQLHSCEHEIKLLNEQMCGLQNDNASLEARGQVQGAVASTCVDAITDLPPEITPSSLVSDQESELTTKRILLHLKSLEKMEKDVKSMCATHRTLGQSRIADLKDRINVLTAGLAQSESLNDADSAVERGGYMLELEQRNQELERQVATQLRAMHVLEEELQAESVVARGKVQALQNELESTRSDLVNTEAVIVAAEQRVTRAEQQVQRSGPVDMSMVEATHANQLKALTSKIADLESELMHHQQESVCLTEENSQSQTQLNRAELEMDTLRDLLATTKSEMEENLTALRSQLESTQQTTEAESRHNMALEKRLEVAEREATVAIEARLHIEEVSLL